MFFGKIGLRCILNLIKSLGNCLSLLWEVTQATRVVVIPSMPKCLILNICGEKICNISCIYLMHFKDVCFLNIFAGFLSIFAHCHESSKTTQLKLQNTKKNILMTKSLFKNILCKKWMWCVALSWGIWS